MTTYLFLGFCLGVLSTCLVVLTWQMLPGPTDDDA